MRSLPSRALAVFLGAVYGPLVARASEGDRDSQFSRCVHQCERDAADRGGVERAFHLKLLLWDDSSECRYGCTRESALRRESLGLPPVKYFGKWPFHRVAGVQEVCASLFSFLNFLPHFFRFLRPNWPPNHPLAATMRTYSLVGMNVWIWATVFHMRDLPWTELMDYFSAIGGISYQLWALVHRLLAYRGPGREEARKGTIVFSGMCIALFYFSHLIKMLIHFDYGYNMKVGLFLALLTDIGWIIYFFRIRGRPYVKRMTITFVVLNASVALELLDFPPIWGYFDAHAAWHLSTVPSVFLWYHYLEEDLRWDEKEAGDASDCKGFRKKKG